jgi:hypothetical protein
VANSKKGSWRPPAGAPPQHEVGFGHALSDALANTGWAPGAYPDVKVEYSMEVHVENPGVVWVYHATITS